MEIEEQRLIAREHLIYWQEYFYNKYPYNRRPNNGMTDERVKEILRAINEPDDLLAVGIFRYQEHQRLNDLKNKPTQYEEPGIYSIMSKYIEDIEGMVENSPYELPQNYLFGTVPSYRVNGFASPVSGTSFNLICLESGLFTYANLFCKNIANSFPLAKDLPIGWIHFSNQEQDIKKRIDDNPIILDRFFDMIEAYVIQGNPNRAPQYILGQLENQIHLMLLPGFEIFIISHEFGHIIGNHFETTTNEGENATYLTNWLQEYEADTTGLNITSAVLQKNEMALKFSYIGVEAALLGIEIIERAVSVLKCGSVIVDYNSDTHPPTIYRREHYREALRRKYPAEISEEIIMISTIIELIVNYTWEKVEPRLLKLHKDGIQLSPHWR